MYACHPVQVINSPISVNFPSPSNISSGFSKIKSKGPFYNPNFKNTVTQGNHFEWLKIVFAMNQLSFKKIFKTKEL